MAPTNNWYFTPEVLTNSPSWQDGVNAAVEIGKKIEAAIFTQDLGGKLHLSQKCINTAVVFIHRIYVFRSLIDTHKIAMATAALLLASKMEYEVRTTEQILKAAECLLQENRNQGQQKSNPIFDVNSEPMAMAALFLAAKVKSEQRPSEHLLKEAECLLAKDQRKRKYIPALDVNSEAMVKAAFFLAGKVRNEIRPCEQLIKAAERMLNQEQSQHNGLDINSEAVSIAAKCLTAKVEDQPGKTINIEQIIKMGHALLNRNSPELDVGSEVNEQLWTFINKNKYLLHR